MADEVFRLESALTARAKRVQTAQHVVGALVLISNGWTHLSGHHRGLAVAEIAAGLILVGSVIVEKVRHSRGLHSGVGIAELGGAAMLYVEAVIRLYEPHTVALRIVSFVAPTVLLLFGLFDVRLQQLPRLTATDDEFKMRIRFLRRGKVRWSEVKSARADGENVYVERNDGTTKRFKLRDVKNRDAAIAWAMEQFQRRGLAAE